jgi:uncharacterized protein with GYD domain
VCFKAVSVTKFPDNQAALKAAARVGNLMNAQTLTMAAVEQEDFLKLLSEV